MPKSNTKLLTKKDLEYFRNEYTLELYGDYVLVSTKGYNRTVLHKLTDNFSINAKQRKITITSEAMQYWKDYFKDKWSLIEVQNAINALSLGYQTIDKDTIENQLNLIRNSEEDY